MRCLETCRSSWWPSVRKRQTFKAAHFRLNAHCYSCLLVKCVKNVPAYLAERLFSAMKVKCANPAIYFCVYVQILAFVLSLFCVFPQRALVTADCFCFF